jgi:hypothetical protein
LGYDTIIEEKLIVGHGGSCLITPATPLELEIRRIAVRG